MLILARALLLLVSLIIGFVISVIIGIVRPANPSNVYVITSIMKRLSKFLGLHVELRGQYIDENCVFIANHQNTFDLFTHTHAVPPNTVSVGKKSILYMPFFGLLYWLTGNILIDRGDRKKAIATLGSLTKRLKGSRINIWIFPEGTRSRGKGILPFKRGAFHTAIDAGVPIVPVVASCQSDLSLSRLNNGKVIIEVLAPISTIGKNANQLAEEAHAIMKQKFDELNQEIKGK